MFSPSSAPAREHRLHERVRLRPTSSGRPLGRLEVLVHRDPREAERRKGEYWWMRQRLNGRTTSDTAER